MIQSRSQARFREHFLPHRFVQLRFLGRQLQCHVTLQFFIARVVDDTHPAGAGPLEHHVMAELFADHALTCAAS